MATVGSSAIVIACSILFSNLPDLYVSICLVILSLVSEVTGFNSASAICVSVLINGSIVGL